MLRRVVAAGYEPIPGGRPDSGRAASAWHRTAAVLVRLGLLRRQPDNGAAFPTEAGRAWLAAAAAAVVPGGSGGGVVATVRMPRHPLDGQRVAVVRRLPGRHRDWAIVRLLNRCGEYPRDVELRLRHDCLAFDRAARAGSGESSGATVRLDLPAVRMNDTAKRFVETIHEAVEAERSSGAAKPEACPQCDSGDVTAAYRLPPGTWKCQTCGAIWKPRAAPKVKTFWVLAGAYKGKSADLKSTLSHTCELDETGYPVRVLCSGVKIDHICPDYGSDEPPSCPRCLPRDPRFKEARR